MSLNHSPQIVTEGLVIHYDMFNSKSWKGQPGTNFSYNNGQGGSEYLAAGYIWTNSGAWNYSSNETDVPLPNIPGFNSSNLRIMSGVVTTASTQGLQFGCGYTSVSPNTTYNFSVYYRQNRAMANNASPYIRSNANDNLLAYFNYNGSTNPAEWPVHQWIRITASATTAANENAIYLSSYFGEQVGDKIWMCGHQVELGTYPSPLMASPRTATNSLVDLSGLTTISISSLTYSSDNRFKFNGSSSPDRIGYASSNSAHVSVTNSTSRTWEVFVRRTGAISRAGIFGHKAGPGCSYYCNGGIYFLNGRWYYNWYDNSSYQWLDSGVDGDQNRWYHVVGTYNGTDQKCRIYVNGQLKATSGATNNNYGNSSAYYELGYNSDGAFDYFAGDIIVARYYFNKALSDDEVYRNYNSQKARFIGNSSDNPARRATDIKVADPTAPSGLYWIDLPEVGPTQLYCDMTTAGGGWVHIGTFSDNNEASNNSTNHPWAYPLNQTNDTGIWEDDSTLGSQTFTADFKNSGWSKYHMTQMLMKDQGATQRNLFYTSALSDPLTMSAFWQQRTWGAYGSDSSSSAYSGGRVYGLGITNFSITDPVFDSGSKSIILFKYGEYDGAQDVNKDRTMIAWHRHNAADGVDAPGGIGCFTNRSGTLDYRDIIPTVSGGGDFPPANISNAPYNYTLWVR